MKFRETEFFREFTAIIAGCVLLVASLAFVSIPACRAHNPADRMELAKDFHLT